MGAPLNTRVHSPEVFATILAEVARQGTLTAGARAVGVTPGAITHWAKRFPDFGKDLQEALAEGIEAMADEVLRIVDGDDLDDEVDIVDADGVRKVGPRRVKLAAAGGDPVARARLRAETRMKLIAARAPDRYGNKVLHAGHDGGAIKHEQAIDIRALAAQIREAAAGRVIEHDSAPGSSPPRFDREGSLVRRALSPPAAPAATATAATAVIEQVGPENGFDPEDYV